MFAINRNHFVPETYPSKGNTPGRIQDHSSALNLILMPDTNDVTPTVQNFGTQDFLAIFRRFLTGFLFKF